MFAKSLIPKAITYIINLTTTFTAIREEKRLLFLYNALLYNLSWILITKIIDVIILIARKICWATGEQLLKYPQHLSESGTKNKQKDTNP